MAKRKKDKRAGRLLALQLQAIRRARRADRRRRKALRVAKRYRRKGQDAQRKGALKEARQARDVASRQRRKARAYREDRRARRKSLRYRLKLKPKDGLAYWGGKQVAAWIVPFLEYGRAHGWSGGVTSGYRSYAKQWWIYYVARIRPAARPGTSNHEGINWPRGAVDVSDPWTLARITRGVSLNGRHLVHYGPGDIWHLSATGR